MFIVIDGPDGAGTTTHAKLLTERLAKDGHDVVLTCEPTDQPIGKMIRELLFSKTRLPSSAFQLLYTADRAQHVEQVIKPALAAGKTVVSDRYWYSTVAYGDAFGVDAEWLKRANGNFPAPDVTIFAMPPLEVCMQRISLRENRDMHEKQDVQERVIRAYEKQAADDSSIIIIDTSVDIRTVGEKMYEAAVHPAMMV